MSLSLTKLADSDNVEGRLRSVIFDITFDTSYVANGMAITPANVGLNKIMGARHIGGNPAAGVLMFNWDTTNGKLMAMCPTGGATAPTSLTAPVAAAPGNGTLAVTTTPDAGGVTMTGSAAKPALAGVVSGALAAPALTAGQAKEMGATADLSTLTIRVQFFGN